MSQHRSKSTFELNIQLEQIVDDLIQAKRATQYVTKQSSYTVRWYNYNKIIIFYTFFYVDSQPQRYQNTEQ